jgi:hypothetical protein
MKYLILFFLVGCNLKSEEYASERIKRFRCNEEQFKLVMDETRFCLNTTYTSDFCFAQAKISICDSIRP